MSETFRTAWLSDIVDIIDKPETNRIICHGKEFVLVRHGRWVIERGETVMHCYSCGWAYEYYDGLEEEWNYCPHCGAKMDEDEWEEDEINPCRGCIDYDGRGECKSNGGCGR